MILKPTAGAEFGGSALPGDWTSAPWSAGGGATVAGGRLQVDGASAGTNATYSAGRTLEFDATFTAAPFQTAGFATDLNAPPWATFSTQGDSLFYARTHNGSASTNTPLPSSLLGSEHRYRIEWDAGEVRFFVDDNLVVTHTLTFADNMRPLTSDLNPGGTGLSLDWLRMSPYPASGNFDSRVFDAGQSADWGALAWSADTPAGTGVALSVRTGNTPTPGPGWSSFSPIAASGGDIPGNSRYLQYRAALSSSDPGRTPALSEVSVGYTPGGGGADTTPPTISTRNPAADATDVAADTDVEVGFSEPMNPATIDGTSFRLHKQGAGADVPASVSYAGATATLDPNADLDPGAVYEVTVAGSVEDTAGNPLGDDDTWSFTTANAALSFTDTTSADFGGGQTGADTYVSQTANGELTLRPTVGEEFSGGPGVPVGWQVTPWNVPGTGGGATVSAGHLVLNGASAGTTQTYGAGRSLEAVATLGGANFQHVGFGVDYNENPNWAMFSIKADGTLNARTNNAGSQTETQLSGSLLGSPHLYRIEWAPTEVRYFVDGGLVATHAADYGATQMRPLVSDLFNGDAAQVSLDWLRMSPYPASGNFDSRVFDAGQSADWGALAWSADTPAGTGVALSVRTGNTPTPGPGWSSFSPIAASGGDIPGNSRYLQYRAALSSSDPGRTPALSEVSVGYTPGGGGADTTPPTISTRNPAADATDVAADTDVEVGFSEPMNPATIDGTSFRLHKQGAGADVPASVSYAGATATLDPNADLDPGAVYEVTVAGSVEDTAGNPLGDDDTWSFTTANAALSFTDTTSADFGGGQTGADTYVSQTANGELTLRPTVGEEFSGGVLMPLGWSSATWESQGGGSGGTATVGGGALHVNGAYASTDTTYGAGHSLEAVATLGAASFQHVGFSDNFAGVWAMFSTGNTNNQVFVRTDTGPGPEIQTAIPGSLIGTPHLYRIEWAPTEVRYFVDGSLVATHAATFTTAMRPIASDFNAGGPEVSVDWMRMSPYPGSGSFDSRVFDAGQNADWDALEWSADTPAGTGVALSVRTGNTPTPGPGWSSFSPIAASGGDIPGSARYAQYRAALSSSDANLTPVLSSVTLNATTSSDDDPVAVNDQATVAEDADATAINVLANDTDDGGTKQIASATQPAHGTVVVNAAGDSLTYKPNADYCNSQPGGQPDTFTYELNGGSTATVAVTVTCADDNPVAVNDQATVAEDADATAINVLANDTDDGGTKQIASATQPAHGTVVVNAAGDSLTYKPNADYCNSQPGGQPDTFTYELNGGSTATVAVTVTCADDNPVAVNDQATVAEDADATAINVLANDTDDGGTKQIASATQPAHGTVVVNAAGDSLTYKPNADYCNSQPGGQPDTFTYELNGGSTATVAVTVTCADDNPVAVNDQATVAEDADATAINVLANDTDDGGTKQIASATQPAHGTVVVNAAGDSLTYKPNADYCNSQPGGQPDTFTYELNGGSTATVAVTVTCADDNPVAVNDQATVAEDADATAINVLANDTDDGGTKQIASATQPAHGTVVVNAAGDSLTYKPNADYCNSQPGGQPDTFTYELNGGSTATVAVTVTCADDNPVAVNDQATVAEDADATAINVLANDTDDGGTKQIASATQPAHGTVVVNAAGDSLTYKPNADYCNSQPGGQPDTFTYELNGGSTATVAVTVTCADDNPVAVNDQATVAEDADATAINVLANDTDDGGTKQIASATQPAHGTVVVNAAGDSLTYKPNADYCNSQPGGQPDTFTYELNGGSTATVAVTVTCADDNPVAVNDQATVAEDADATAINVLANDTDDGGTKQIASATQPAHGTVVVNAAGDSLTYKPNADYCNSQPGGQPDTFTYELNGGSTATVAVTVTCADDNPVAVNDQATVAEDADATAINVLANDTDDGGTKQIASATQPAHGTVVVNAAGDSLTYKPNADYCNSQPGGQPDTFTYELNGGSTATVAVTVTCADDNPVAVNDQATVAEDADATAINVLANDTDDGGTKQIASATQPAHGTVVVNAAGDSLTYKPNADYCNSQPGGQPDTFTYELNGGSTATVAVTVTCADDNPVAVNDQATVAEDADATAINVLANDTDDGGTKQIASATQPAHGTVVVNAAGDSLTYKPNADYCNSQPGGQPDTFTYELNGGSTATVAVTVTCADDNPVAVNDQATVAEDADATAINVLANDTDDGGTKQIASATQPAHGTVVVNAAGDSLTYKPNADYCNSQPGGQPDTFTYELNGGSTATVAVTVTCADDNPVAVNDQATVAEDADATAINVLANDTDDGGTKQIASATQPAHGTVVVNAAGDSLTYKPNADYCNSQPGGQPDTFTYELNGGSTATVAVTVTCADDNPVAVNDQATVAEDADATAINVLANDTDDGGTKQIASATQPAHGTVVVNAAGDSLTYKPNADYCNSQPGGQPDTFTYELNGGSTATVAVTVTCVSVPAVSVADAVPRSEGGTALSFNVTLAAPSTQQVKVDYATVDGTAKAPGDYTAKSGTLTFAPGETSKPVSVSSVEDALDEDNETFTLKLSNSVQGTVADGEGLGTILDDDALPSLRVSDASRPEGGAAFTFNVSLSAPSGREVKVDYATLDGTAKAPGDYAPQSDTLTFAPGETSKPVSVSSVQDALDEDNETFTLRLSNSPQARIADANGVATINDDDPLPSLSVGDAISRPEGGAPLTFTISLSPHSGRQVKVSFATVDGSAKAPRDYKSKSGTMTFAPGETSKEVSVASVQDNAREPDETFTLRLSKPAQATIADANGLATILNDD